MTKRNKILKWLAIYTAVLAVFVGAYLLFDYSLDRIEEEQIGRDTVEILGDDKRFMVLRGDSKEQYVLFDDAVLGTDADISYPFSLGGAIDDISSNYVKVDPFVYAIGERLIYIRLNYRTGKIKYSSAIESFNETDREIFNAIENKAD